MLPSQTAEQKFLWETALIPCHGRAAVHTAVANGVPPIPLAEIPNVQQKCGWMNTNSTTMRLGHLPLESRLEGKRPKANTEHSLKPPLRLHWMVADNIWLNILHLYSCPHPLFSVPFTERLEADRDLSSIIFFVNHHSHCYCTNNFFFFFKHRPTWPFHVQHIWET